MLSRAAMTSATMVERFRRQVQIMAQLRHPNLIVAYEGGRLEGVPYFTMEYIEGQDLRSQVKRGGPLPVQEAVEYTIQAAAGLACAHAQGIWHRNVKPANLMVDRSGSIRVTGFGLAHLNADPEERAITLTLQGQAMGTGDYMAPEQTLDASSVDARADVYSLGCTLCMLLTGRPPYRANSWEKMVGAHLTAPIPSLPAMRPEVPQALDAVFQKMLAKQPRDRYASMEEVIAALRGAMAPGAAVPPGLLGTDLPTVAWPEPQVPGMPVAPAPDAQSPVGPAVAWPDLPTVAWPEPQAPGIPVAQSPGEPSDAWPDVPTVAWPEPQGSAVPLVPPDLPASTGSAGPLGPDFFEKVKDKPRIPRWVIRAVGYGTAVALGLALGWLLMRWLLGGIGLP
jgi:serine/threonine protein kinase